MSNAVMAKISNFLTNVVLAVVLFSGVTLLLALVTGTLKNPSLVSDQFWDTGY